ncbi:hypothetical protein ACN47E_010056 [Coniothyrium glycines]
MLVHPEPRSGLANSTRRRTLDWAASSRPAGQKCSIPPTTFEKLPVEIVDHILSYLTYPRAHLPGLTQAQSVHDFPVPMKSAIKAAEDLALPADRPHWATNLFSLHLLPHPLNALAATSRRCHELVESYCSHLVRACNRNAFNLPFAHLDRFGPQCVYPDLSRIVYRRLWLQLAPRRCVYCFAVLDCYPFARVKYLLTSCSDCFYRLTLDIEEVRSQFHISPATVAASPHIRGGPSWVLRTDVEALALQLYRTRAFHSAHIEQLGKPCSLCAITCFLPDNHIMKPRTTSKAAVRLIANIKKRSSKRIARHQPFTH